MFHLRKEKWPNKICDFQVPFFFGGGGGMTMFYCYSCLQPECLCGWILYNTLHLQVNSSSLVEVERDYLSLDKRYPRLFVSPDVSKVCLCDFIIYYCFAYQAWVVHYLFTMSFHLFLGGCELAKGRAQTFYSHSC